jgi:hypothetical protein
MGNAPPRNKAGTVDNFTDEEFASYEPNCRPGGNGVNEKHCFLGLSFGSDAGFIDDKEALKDVALRDHHKVVELLGPHGHDMIALKLTQCFGSEENDKFISTIVSLPPCRENFSVQTQSWCGNQGCPFWKEIMFKSVDDKPEEATVSPCGGVGGCDHTITNLKTGESMTISALMSHLIFYHHFYEGNTSYRTDPEKLIRLLEIDPKMFDGAKWDVIARDEKGVFIPK